MLLNLLDESTTQATTTPVIPSATSNLFQAGNLAALMVSRAGTTGNLAVYGANAGDPNQQTASFRAKGDGTTVAFDAPAAITYAAFSNYNWIVVVGGVVLTQGATADASHYQVSNPSGTVARITFGAAIAANAEIIVHKVTVTTVLTAGGNRAKYAQVQCYDFMWTDLGATPSATSVALVSTFS